MEKWKTKSRFPTFPQPFYLSEAEQNSRLRRRRKGDISIEVRMGTFLTRLDTNRDCQGQWPQNFGRDLEGWRRPGYWPTYLPRPPHGAGSAQVPPRSIQRSRVHGREDPFSYEYAETSFDGKLLRRLPHVSSPIYGQVLVDGSNLIWWPRFGTWWTPCPVLGWNLVSTAGTHRDARGRGITSVKASVLAAN